MNIDELLQIMVAKKASDLHLKVPALPTLRLRGELYPMQDRSPLAPADVQDAFEAITTDSQRERFKEEMEIDLAYSIPGVARFRVNASLQRGTIALAFRVIPFQVVGVEELGLPEVCKNLALKPRGLVLVTGPTGSGKSTTLAAMIDYLNERESRHVVTIEDPIEFLHQDKRCVIAQRELGGDTHSFANALKHVLRQDPDVILIGEMRDVDTIAVAITAAETGHLVLATLHTTSASQTVDRIIDVFPPAQQQQIRMQLSLVLEGILCQILLPTADGQGRVVAVEVLLANPAVRNLIREAKTHQIPTIMQLSAQMGMQTLDQALASVVRRGIVTREEAMARAANSDELRKLLAPHAL
ncbi:MAG: type IV pilus twitching motility protein PilT [Chloroflexi bacterium]|nr:type IV pilus twitching motility protein PilT [Chloroflexota bacterium]